MLPRPHEKSSDFAHIFLINIFVRLLKTLQGLPLSHLNQKKVVEYSGNYITMRKIWRKNQSVEFCVIRLVRGKTKLMSIALVTGGAGFIGSHLSRALLRAGYEVRIVDNFSTGRRANLKEIRGDIRLSRADVRDFAAMRKAMRGVSKVFHLAAVSSVPQSVEDPVTTFDANIGGTRNILEAARLASVDRVVFVSSASVYGSKQKVPFKESMTLRGSSPYAASKLIGEQLCDLYLRLYGLETVALRLFSVYGPRQNPFSQYANVIPAFATRLLAGEIPTIYGTGKQTRDFIFVGDVARAFVAASRKKSVLGEVINFGSGKQTSVIQLLKSIQTILGVESSPRFLPLKPGDDPKTCADTRKAKKLLGITKLMPFNKGLAQTVRWFKENS